MGDFSIYVHWTKADGSTIKVQSKASRYAKLRNEILSGGGYVRKVTRIGGGAKTWKKDPSGRPYVAVEDKLLFKPKIPAWATTDPRAFIPVTMRKSWKPTGFRGQAVDLLKQAGITPGTIRNYGPITISHSEPGLGYSGARIDTQNDPKAYEHVVREYELFLKWYAPAKARIDYKTSGQVPNAFKNLINVPGPVARRKLSNEFEKLAYELALGLTTEAQAEETLYRLMEQKKREALEKHPIERSIASKALGTLTGEKTIRRPSTEEPSLLKMLLPPGTKINERMKGGLR